MSASPYLNESLNVKFYRQLHSVADAAFYRAELGEHGGREDFRVLELGCGDGRILEILSGLGLQAVGIDHSLTMLKRCKSLPGVRTQEGDMRDFDMGGECDRVILGFRTFHMLTEDREQEACFRSVKRHLKVDGEFILHLMHPDPKVTSSPPLDKTVKVEGATLTRRTLEFRADMVGQRHISKVVFELWGDDGATVQPERSEEEMMISRWIWPDQLRDLGARTGLIISGFTSLGCDRIYRIKHLWSQD